MCRRVCSKTAGTIGQLEEVAFFQLAPVESQNVYIFPALKFDTP